MWRASERAAAIPPLSSPVPNGLRLRPDSSCARRRKGTCGVGRSGRRRPDPANGAPNRGWGRAPRKKAAATGELDGRRARHLPAGDMHPHVATASTGGDHAAVPAPAAASEYALYPTLSPEDVAPPRPPPYHAAAAYSAPAAFAVMVVIPLAQLRSVNTSTSRTNAAEKYIRLVSIDNHEFWFMGFVYYDRAIKNLQEALQEGHALQAQ